MTRKITPRHRRTTTATQGAFSPRWLERYGRTLTDDEIRLVQAFRGLPAERQTHLLTYASGLIVELASKGRVLAATAELAEEIERRSRAAALSALTAVGLVTRA